MIKKSYHIFLTNDNEYLVTKIMETSSIVVSKIISKHDSLEEAQNFLNEDGVPGNAVAAGNVQGFDPLFGGRGSREKRRKKLLRRLAPMLSTK